jgi:TATA-box binding protein (TBP) (component of TFIID and TFIIIB)
MTKDNGDSVIDQSVKIVNIVAFKHSKKYIDLVQTAKMNPDQITYDETKFRFADLKPLGDHGKLIILKGGLQIMGAKTVNEARYELESAVKRIKWVYCESQSVEKRKKQD